jgi:glyoxylase-like metal-dependent hydrolase (beta-lactamase superfamily II)
MLTHFSNWLSMHALPPDIVFFERGWLSSNNVLLIDASQAVLVDTGYHLHSQQTASLLSNTLSGRALTAIFNTHLHSDHCGGNAHLQSLYSNVEVRIPPGHANLVDAWDEDGLTYRVTGQHCPKFTRSGLLKHGDALQVAGKTWTVHSAPGHDPHSVVLFNEEDRVLISADALWENGFGVVFPEIEGIHAFEEVEATLQMIEELGVKTILPGHGGMFSDVSSALVRARSRLSQFRTAPDQHASYAAKVLIKFKLLEFQSVSTFDLLKWAESVPYLALLHRTYGSGNSFDLWFESLCASLEKSNACIIQDGYIKNT